MARVLRLTEGEFQGLLSSILGLVTGGTQTNQTQSDDTSTTDSESIGKISEKGQALLNNPKFKKKLSDISSSIGIDENSIIKLMNHESGLNPSVKNPIGCVGLIQFCPDTSGGSTKTIAGKTYKLSDLQNDLDLQMNAIKEFWSVAKRSGKLKGPEDLYIFNFWPAAAGKTDDFTLETKGMSATTVAKANPIFNRKLGKPISSPLTVGDLKQYYRKTGMV